MSSETAWHCSETPEAAYGAGVIARTVLGAMPSIQSVGDVGCSIGTFLKVFADAGVGNLQGFDARWVDQTRLVIPADAFKVVDLTAPMETSGHTFDLLVCLEVAEHLPEERAQSFVADLCAMSETVLFSAAIPGQGGVGHVNEQWQSYWCDLFAANGYRPHDHIRNAIWNDPGVPVWYRQNIMLYSKRQLELPVAGEMIDVVHPDQYLGVHYRDTAPGMYLRNKLDRVMARLGVQKEG